MEPRHQRTSNFFDATAGPAVAQAHSGSATIVSPLLTPDEAAAWLRVKKGHLARLRVVGGGPPFVKLSRRCIAYRLEDLEAFIAARIRRSTSHQGN
jgi:hypothetical protein